MPRERHCLVKECNSCNEFVTFFKAPKDPELFNSWFQKFYITGILLKKSSYVCELHFKESDLIRTTIKKSAEVSNHQFIKHHTTNLTYQ